MLEHGGGVIAASKRYAIPIEDWLDLSTGINPNGWPVPEIPAAIWRRLPETEDGLIQAAAAYYRTNSLLPVAGSQTAIQALPKLRSRCRVGVLTPSYNEHRYAWSRAGHTVANIAADELDAAIAQLDVVVLCNPNNPTAGAFATETLLAWHAKLAAKGGWLVVDEAFIDATPESSIARHAGENGLIVLRSLGKFFGLAGARVGFVLAAVDFLDALSDRLGPWTVTGPSRFVATQALEDRSWQETTRARLVPEAQRLAALLSRHGLAPNGGTALFQWTRTSRAVLIHEHLARLGILTRLFTEPPGLRFGLPAGATQWQRLDAALTAVARFGGTDRSTPNIAETLR